MFYAYKTKPDTGNYIAVNRWINAKPKDDKCRDFTLSVTEKEISDDQLISWGRVMRKRINEEHNFIHPEDPTINSCSHILWTGAVIDKTSTSRNAVFYGEKAIDRSPCGTGTSARMAQWYAKGKLKKGEVFIHESIIGSKFNGTIEEEMRKLAPEIEADVFDALSLEQTLKTKNAAGGTSPEQVEKAIQKVRLYLA